MIKYDAAREGLFFIIRWKGSVFPRALVWAVPNAILAVTLHILAQHEQYHVGLLNMQGVNMLWAGYTSVLGFLVVFRNNQAYTRFWEGATLINQVRGEWFNAVSSLFAFCNQAQDPDRVRKVEIFQHTLIRLASMLYCSALQQVCDLKDDTLEIIENDSMDPDSLGFMQDCNDRCEILLQWIQRLIVDSEESKTIKIAPPLLTRAFQELSRGIVNLNNARKIKDIPFPFPYAQMITCMMMVHWVVTPLFASQVIDSPLMAGFVCFFVTFSFWCLIYIALEIDQPFGEDANDLPLREMQRDFNQSLLMLMHPLAQKVPIYHIETIPKETLHRLGTGLSLNGNGYHNSHDQVLGKSVPLVNSGSFHSRDDRSPPPEQLRWADTSMPDPMMPSLPAPAPDPVPDPGVSLSLLSLPAPAPGGEALPEAVDASVAPAAPSLTTPPPPCVGDKAPAALMPRVGSSTPSRSRRPSGNSLVSARRPSGHSQVSATLGTQLDIAPPLRPSMPARPSWRQAVGIGGHQDVREARTEACCGLQAVWQAAGHPR